MTPMIWSHWLGMPTPVDGVTEILIHPIPVRNRHEYYKKYIDKAGAIHGRNVWWPEIVKRTRIEVNSK